MAYIYKTTNLINKKIYIGKSKGNEPSYLGSGKILGNSIKKYGAENFSKEILEECSDDEVDEREKFWIKEFRSQIRDVGYNIAGGGAGGDTLSHHPNKGIIRAQQAESMKNWYSSLSEQERSQINLNISNSKKGRGNGRTGTSHSPDTIQKMRDSANDRENSEAWITAHADAMSKRMGQPFPQKYKPVIVNGIEYESVKHAQQSLNMSTNKYYRWIREKKLKVEYK